jgi:two-component system, NtrC family, sensor kinase
VVMNLLVNAAQAFSPDADARRISISLSSEHGWAQLSVEDNGRGIPEDTLPRIFEPFFTTKIDSGGTGLGLAIVRDVVHRHGGEISVKSRLGQGTTFRVTLPLEATRSVDLHRPLREFLDGPDAVASDI